MATAGMREQERRPATAPTVGEIRRHGWFLHVSYISTTTVLLTRARPTRDGETAPHRWPDGWTSLTDHEFPVNRPRSAVARMRLIAAAPATTTTRTP